MNNGFYSEMTSKTGLVIILAVNGKSIKGVDELRKLIEHKNKHAALLIQRGDDKIFV